MTEHNAVIYDRSLGNYRPIYALEILGRKNEIRFTGTDLPKDETQEAQYARQLMIPGWDQRSLARQKVAIVGAGGDGAHVIATLVSMGVGTEGWITAIDPDIVEQSNLPRIPYAFPEHVGVPKVAVAAQYVGRKNPAVRFYPYPCAAEDKVCRERIKAATVIIGAGDNDGVRKTCNDLAVHYLIPYIDLGCDIQVEEKETVAGGQVRLVLPGQNACLVCCRGFDPAAAALEQLDDESKAAHAEQGYVIGADVEATPSVTNLNATTTQLGIACFLSLIHGKEFGQWDYAHFDQFTANTLVANTQRNSKCPLCGKYGVLGTGDRDDPPTNSPAPVNLQAIKPHESLDSSPVEPHTENRSSSSDHNESKTPSDCRATKTHCRMNRRHFVTEHIASRRENRIAVPRAALVLRHLKGSTRRKRETQMNRNERRVIRNVIWTVAVILFVLAMIAGPPVARYLFEPRELAFLSLLALACLLAALAIRDFSQVLLRRKSQSRLAKGMAIRYLVMALILAISLLVTIPNHILGRPGTTPTASLIMVMCMIAVWSYFLNRPKRPHRRRSSSLKTRKSRQSQSPPLPTFRPFKPRQAKARHLLGGKVFRTQCKPHFRQRFSWAESPFNRLFRKEH